MAQRLSQPPKHPNSKKKLVIAIFCLDSIQLAPFQSGFGNRTRGGAQGPYRRLCNLDRTNINELGFQHGFAIFQQHPYQFAEVLLNLSDVGTLGVSTRPARYVADQVAGGQIALDDKLERSHRRALPRLSEALTVRKTSPSQSAAAPP